nr:MAG TPA: hypothetical protein [Caudoviricetes sp.]
MSDQFNGAAGLAQQVRDGPALLAAQFTELDDQVFRHPSLFAAAIGGGGNVAVHLQQICLQAVVHGALVLQHLGADAAYLRGGYVLQPGVAPAGALLIGPGLQLCIDGEYGVLQGREQARSGDGAVQPARCAYLGELHVREEAVIGHIGLLLSGRRVGSNDEGRHGQQVNGVGGRWSGALAGAQRVAGRPQPLSRPGAGFAQLGAAGCSSFRRRSRRSTSFFTPALSFKAMARCRCWCAMCTLSSSSALISSALKSLVPVLPMAAQPMALCSLARAWSWASSPWVNSSTLASTARAFTPVSWPLMAASLISSSSSVGRLRLKRSGSCRPWRTQ